MSNDLSLFMPLSEEELDQLEILLEDPAFQEEALRLDEVQGYLCAALSGLRSIAEEDWLVDILGSEEALDTEPGKKAAALLRRFASSLESSLAAGETPTLLLYPEDEESDISDYLAWCQAYLSGVDAAEEDWFESLGYEEGKEKTEDINYLDECLFPFMTLSGEAEAAAIDHGEVWPSDEELSQLKEECKEDLPQAVVDIYQFWLKIRNSRRADRVN